MSQCPMPDDVTDPSIGIVGSLDVVATAVLIITKLNVHSTEEKFPKIADYISHTCHS